MDRQEYFNFVKALFTDMEALIHRKNNDYSLVSNPFSNFEASLDFGVDPLTGLSLRMGDKFERIKTFCREGKLQAEGVEDAYRDLIGYSCIALAMLAKRKVEGV